MESEKLGMGYNNEGDHAASRISTKRKKSMPLGGLGCAREQDVLAFMRKGGQDRALLRTEDWGGALLKRGGKRGWGSLDTFGERGGNGKKPAWVPRPSVQGRAKSEKTSTTTAARSS